MDKDQKQDLRRRLPDWLHEHGFPLTRSFRCLNPAHADNHPSMRYNPKNETVHCFSCGMTYDLFELIGMEEGKEDFPSQLKAAQSRYGHETKPAGPLPYWEKDLTVFARRGAMSRTEQDFAYFQSRGISREAVERYGLFVENGRAVLPVWREGVCVSWCSRAVDPALRPRYRNSPGAMGIWGFDSLLTGDCTVLAVCEGIFDAISMELCGCRAVALCGAANVRRLLEELRLLPGPLPVFVLAGDEDEAGGRMRRELEEGLRRMGADCVELVLPDGCKDVNEALVQDEQSLRQAVEEAVRVACCGSARDSEEYEQNSLAGMASAFLEYLDRSRVRPALSSGLPGLDALLGGGVFPGLYVLGAPSSLGKTTLLLQMADSMAAAGQDVLFFSLEMSRWELLAKSLSRRAGAKSPLSVREILQGKTGRAQLEKLLEEYNRACGCRFFSVCCETPPTPGELAAQVRRHRERRGRAPVVFVDYLQILAPQDPRATDKQNIDRAVLVLKALSRELDIPVFAVSSFNRESYTKGASMEAFKESGAVEYAADVLLALQMTALGQEGFDLNREKAADPRREDLVLLKNRSGVPFGTVPLLYHAKANLFEQASASPAPAALNRIGRRR